MREIYRKNYRVFFLLLAVSVVIYAPALRGGFVFDDRSLVVENVHIQQPKFLLELFSHNVHRFSSVQRTDYYRPLQAVSYMADHLIWKMNPFGYHLTSIVLHALVAFLVYGLLAELSFACGTALLAAFFFAVHPVHVSAVAYVAGRADILVTLFLLAGSRCFIRYLGGGGKAALVAAHVALAAALLSRENAMLGPLLFLLAGWARGGRIGRVIRSSAGFLALTLLYAVLRAHFLNSVPLPVGNPLHSEAANLLHVLRGYAALLVWPWPLYPMHAVPWVRVISMPDVFFAVSAAVLAIACLWSDRRHASRELSFAVLWTVVGFLPLVRLIHALPHLGSLMAENWLYLPAVGIAALAARGFARFGRAGFAAAAVAIAFLGIVLFSAAGVWREEIGLYQHALQFGPQNLTVRVNLANAYYEHERYDEALRLLEEALRVNPKDWNAHLSLGNIRRAQGDLEGAREAYEQAIRLNPHGARVWTNLGVLYMKEGLDEAALETFSKASALDPMLWQNWRAIGNLKLKRRDYAAAAAAYARSFALRPGDAIGETSYGVALYQTGRVAEAEKAFKRALVIDSRSVPALKNLGATYANSGRLHEATELWRRALKIAPDDGELRRYVAETTGA